MSKLDKTLRGMVSGPLWPGLNDVDRASLLHDLRVAACLGAEEAEKELVDLRGRINRAKVALDPPGFDVAVPRSSCSAPGCGNPVFHGGLCKSCHHHAPTEIPARPSSVPCPYFEPCPIHPQVPSEEKK